MSEYLILAVVAGFAVIYSLLASRLEKTPVNGALVYVAVGFLVGPSVFGIMDLDINAEGLKALAEITLAIVLFSDSANANLKVIRSDRQLPTRLLLLGLPMTIALGIGLGFILHGQLSWLEIALVATMLAPTSSGVVW